MTIWPQIAMIVWLGGSFTIGLTELADGKKQEGITTIVGIVTMTAILYCGGFFNVLTNGPVLGRFL